MESSLNAWLDRFPRRHLRLGDRLVPSYLALGLSGVAAGALLTIFLAALSNRSVLIVLAVDTIACASFVAYAWARRSLTGVERVVLIEHVLVTLATAAAALFAAGIEPLPYLDLFVSGLAVFLAAGRVGCFLSGCCYGARCSIGVSYPEECGHRDASHRLPVQLFEVALWLWLAATASLLSIVSSPGTALSTTLIAYGLARLVLESLRGDPRRHVFGVRIGSWLAIVVLASGVALDIVRARAMSVRELIFAGVGIALALLVITTKKIWLFGEDVFELRAACENAGRELRETHVGTEPIVREVGALKLGLSIAEGERRALHLSLSSERRNLSRAEASLFIEWMCNGLGVGSADISVDRSAAGVFVATLEARE